MMLWQTWWVWMVAGAIMAILELFAPGFVLLGFAIGAAATGCLLLVGLLGGSAAVMIFVFALASLVAWAVLRAVFGLRKDQVRIWTKDINDN